MSRRDIARQVRSGRKKGARSQPAGGGDRAARSAVEACCVAGLEALRNDRFDEARSWAKQCEAAPGSKDAARCAALHVAIAGEARELELVAAHLRRAAELAPKDATIARLLSQALMDGGGLQEAAAVLERVARAGTRDADLLMELGYAQLAGGDTGAARRAFERALSLRPGDSRIRRPLAQIYESLGKAALAAKTLAAIPLETASPRVLGDLIRLHLSLKQYREAENVCSVLASSDPEHALLAQHGLTLGRIKRGDWRGALDVALTATHLDRFDLTTAFLAYAKDRLFSRVPDAERREAELGARFSAELREHELQHAQDEGYAFSGGGREQEVTGG